MPFELLVGPPGSGKTSRAVARAREAVRSGRRTWWVGLPHQRAYAYRRLTRDGPVLGIEFLTIQQVAYRLLADALQLRPVVVGTERIVRVGEALFETQGGVPAPGEARLFAYAIAEAKRYGLTPADLPGDDPESERLRVVFRAYERAKGHAWDYDDFRARATDLAVRGEGRLEAAAIVVDGFRELLPLDMALLRALGRRAAVLATVQETPAGMTPDVVLEPADPPEVRRFRAANPVVEARWVLRSLKRDLAEGLEPTDLAVILPPGRAAAFAALADEFGVPVLNETPHALSDTPAGRRLVDLLTVADAPTGERLAAIPELAPLARALFQVGGVGADLADRLADQLGLAETWRAWRARLDPRGESRGDDRGTGADDVMEWATTMVDLAVAAAGRSDDRAADDRFREQALRLAREASALGSGSHVRAWWTALLREPVARPIDRGGVALLDATGASGRRFARAYVAHAVAGAFRAGETEDYFTPEEFRRPWEDVARHPGLASLPRRIRGLSDTLYRELLTRADRVTVTVPEADQDGPLHPEHALTAGAAPLPPLPAGSELEATGGAPYAAPRSAGELTDPSVERLRRYAECGFRTWAEDVAGARAAAGVGGTADGAALELLAREGDEGSWLIDAGHHRRTRSPADANRRRDLRADLLAAERITPERLHELRLRWPDAAVWLDTHAERLLALRFRVRLPAADDGPYAVVDAAARDGATADLYRFAAPGPPPSREEAEKLVRSRWTELWAAHYVAATYPQRVERVRMWVWPLLGAPVALHPDGVKASWQPVRDAAQGVAEAFVRFRAGDIEPRPGFRCRECLVADVCREGHR